MALMPIGEVIRWQAERDSDRLSIVHEERTEDGLRVTSVTRRQFDLDTNRLARAYAELGVKKDDFVTIALPNGIEFYEASVATWKLGATPQPVSAKLPFLERDQIIDLAEPALIVGVKPGSHGDRTAVPIGFTPDPELSDEPLPSITAKHYKAMTSGGSTGRPKLIVSANPGEADPELEAMEFGFDRAYLVPGPLYHNAPFAFSMGALLRGNTIVIMTRFDAEETLRLIEKYQVDYTVLVPTMMHRIWRLDPSVRDGYDLSSLRVMLHMAAPCSDWLKQSWIDWLGPERIFELYGGTEAQGATWITGSEWLEHRGSVGKPMETSQMKVVGDDGQELPAGEVGEIYMLPETGPGTTYHYLGAAAKALDGWESLGDMGWMDEDGYLYLADRQTDMILSGGANIYPAEIEAAIEAHGGVRSSAAIGLPDDDLGNRVHAVVDCADLAAASDFDAEAFERDLLEHLAERLVRYKIPRSFEFTSQPVRDDAGKVRRSQLRRERIEAAPD